MLNQRKVLSGKSNPIMDLVNYEKSIKQIDAEGPVTVQLASDGKALLLTHGGVNLHGIVSRPIIHQLGGRAWGSDKSFEQINSIWDNKFSNNPSELEQELASVFRKNDLTIRYETNRRGVNNIYGVVTPHFVDVNQLEFRQIFLEQLRENTALFPKSSGVTTNRYGNVVEYFDFDSPGFQTRFKYGMVYAKNNGYDAYKVEWRRLVKICTNGLTEWKGSKFRWKHTREIDLNGFLTGTVQEGVANQEFLEKRINLLRETALKQSLINELMQRLSLARASKNRIYDRLKVEVQDVGSNEWALSQALTWLGSHEKSIAFSVRPQLIGLGTRILEKTLDGTLRDQVQVLRNRKYGLLLPKNFRSPTFA